MPVYALFLEHVATGYMSVLTFPTRFDRADEMIRRRFQQVLMTTKDYV
jgi:hypothetical protein